MGLLKYLFCSGPLHLGHPVEISNPTAAAFRLPRVARGRRLRLDYAIYTTEWTVTPKDSLPCHARGGGTNLDGGLLECVEVRVLYVVPY